MYHKTLERQLTKFLGSASIDSPQWQEFLKAISETYNHADDDRVLIERSLDISSKELSEVNKELRENQKRLVLIFKNIQESIALLQVQPDGNFTFITINEATEKKYGISAKNIVGKTFADVEFTAETASQLNIQAKKTVETKSLVRFEDSYTLPHGTFYVLSIFTPILDDEGNVKQILIVTQDITDQKKAQLELEKQEEFLSKIINTIGDPLFVKDKNHKWVLMNEAFCSLIGQTKEELLNKSDYDFIPKEQADIFWRKDEEVFASGVENVNEEAITSAQGEVLTIVTKKTTYTDANGDKFIVGIIRDITERKKIEDTIKKHDEQLTLFETALKHSPISVVITDEKGTIQYVNQYFEQVTGYTKDEVIGKNPRILKSGEKPVEEYKVLWDTILAGKTWQGEFHNKKKNGDIYWEKALISPLTNASGTITHFIAVKEDVTERKKNEEVMRNRTKELETLNQTMIGRELKMIELKKQIDRLQKQLHTS